MESRHGIPLSSNYFPAYVRLFRWKILEIILESTSNGLFHKFLPCFPKDGELDKLIRFLRNPEEEIDKESKDMNVKPLNPDDIKGDLVFEEGRRRDYIRMLKSREIFLRKKRYVELFFKKVFYNEVGIKIVDQILKEHHSADIYNYVHLNDMPADWEAKQLFFDKFYTKTGLATPYEAQLLDQVSIAARGSEVFRRFSTTANVFEQELKTFNYLLMEDNLHIKSQDLLSVLNIEPLRKDGNELAWNSHITNLLLASLPLFNSKSLAKEDKDEWYFNIIEAMKEDPNNRAALTLLQPDYEDILEQRKKRKGNFDQSAEDGELESEQEQQTTELRPQPDGDLQAESDPIDLELRGYQEELVRPALAGSNTVIVAQTGAGKTEVAIYAALEHLKKNPKKSRVVMLVPKIPLVSQQRDRFLRYCRGKYYVVGIHGAENETNGKGRRDDVLRAHVVIMTPQILVNMWESVRATERLYISDFSMIIFDEVHRATGGHPYVIVSEKVQEYKGKKPQIVGLTASLDVKTNRTTDTASMLQQIYRLLATLDTPCLSTIQDDANQAELNLHVPKPDDSVVSCRQTTRDFTRKAVAKYLMFLHGKLVEEVERLRHTKTCNVFQSNFAQVARSLKLDDTTKYEQWLQQVTQSLNKINSSEKTVAQANVRYLKTLVETLLMLEILPARMGFDHMDSKIKELKTMHLPQFSDYYDKIRDQLYNNRDNQEENEDPCIVKELKDNLVSHFKNTPDSRCIIFVGQRITAERVCSFLNDSGILRSRNDEPAFGYVLGVNNQGTVHQTFKQQEDTLKKFASGHLKVIVSTSVVEEGLDVTSANLIIKYNFATASAIQHIQQRGRARAKNSRSILLVVNSKVNENANNALIAEKCMRMCVDIIQKNGPKHLLNEVNQLKIRMQKEREALANEAKRHEENLKHVNYDVKCSKCDVKFCQSDSIKKSYSNYLIMDPAVWNVLELLQRKSTKYKDADNQPLCTIVCTGCGTDIGKAFKMRGVYVPQFGIKNLAFIKNTGSANGEMVQCGKWQNVETEHFFIAEARESDFRKMLNALNSSESNKKKKKKLDMDSQEFIKELEMVDAMEKRKREEMERKKAHNLTVQKMDWDDFKEEENEEPVTESYKSPLNMESSDQPAWEMNYDDTTARGVQTYG